MSDVTANESVEHVYTEGMIERFLDWIRTMGLWWLMSLVAHMVVLLILGLVLGTVKVAQTIMDAPLFDAEVETALPEPDLTAFDVGETPIEPTVLDTESLSMVEPPKIEQTEQINDDSAIFEERGGGVASSTGPSLGGLGGFDFSGIGAGPAVTGAGGVGGSDGTGNQGGSGGDGSGFGGRGSGMRKAMVGGFGGTKQTERAVAAALNWIARHQNPDGGWSLGQYTRLCKDPSCTDNAATVANSNGAATAFALLPFFAAGQTHKTKGPYQKSIFGGLLYLRKNQLPDGNLSAGSTGGPMMYAHGLASIAMCEAYGLSKDKELGQSAQAAIRFIEAAQNPQSGGWGYNPRKDIGDNSVLGWQVMALKSAQMAGLSVNPRTLEGAKQFLKSTSSGSAGGLFGYAPGGGGTDTMTAVGLLCNQYMGVKKEDPLMVEGTTFLMQRLPTNAARNCYYWYYATQVMHNIPGAQWDTWNRQTRRTLIESQVKEGCAAGSWDPLKPAKDPWGDHGGRLMVTSIAALTLEVYYRYLPLYQTDTLKDFEGEGKKPKAAAKL